MVRTEIQLSDEQAKALKELASQRKISVAVLIRLAIDEQLLAVAQASHEQRKRRAIAAVGRFNSGLGELAANHDQYLADDFGP